jgi:hypothetical protein
MITTDEEKKVTPKQHKTPCHDCPWRRNSIPGWLGNRTPEEWTRVAHSEAFVECHALQQPDGDIWECAGIAIFRANICKRLRDPDVMVLPKDTKRVFAWDNEFDAHHKRRKP